MPFCWVHRGKSRRPRLNPFPRLGAHQEGENMKFEFDKLTDEAILIPVAMVGWNQPHFYIGLGWLFWTVEIKFGGRQ